MSESYSVWKTLVRLSSVISKCEYKELEQLGIDNNIDGLTIGWRKGKIRHDKLVALAKVLIAKTDASDISEAFKTVVDSIANERRYKVVTNRSNSVSRLLVGQLRIYGINRLHTTVNGGNVFYYKLAGLSGHTLIEPV